MGPKQREIGVKSVLLQFASLDILLASAPNIAISCDASASVPTRLEGGKCYSMLVVSTVSPSSEDQD